MRRAVDFMSGVKERVLDRLAFLPPFVTRVVIGLGLLQTGTGKLHNLERTTQFFSSIGIPFAATNALFIGTLETVGGIALLLGLLTRPFAALLTSTMVVALLTADRQSFIDSWSAASEKSPTDIASFVFLLLLLWLLIFGAGAPSADRLIERRFARR